MKVVYANPEKTIGIVTDIPGLKPVGEFKLRDLEAWLAMVKDVFGGEGGVGY